MGWIRRLFGVEWLVTKGFRLLRSTSDPARRFVCIFGHDGVVIRKKEDRVPLDRLFAEHSLLFIHPRAPNLLSC